MFLDFTPLSTKTIEMFTGYVAYSSSAFICVLWRAELRLEDFTTRRISCFTKVSLLFFLWEIYHFVGQTVVCDVRVQIKSMADDDLYSIPFWKGIRVEG